jgi:predicted ester cyclase
MEVEIESIVAEGDLVAVRWSATSTNAGELFGTAPTGQVVTWSSVEFFQFQDGKIAHVDAHPDVVRLLSQLGGQLPGEPPTEESTNRVQRLLQVFGG